MRNRLISLTIALLFITGLSGCAGMADSTSQSAGLGVITQEKSTFDGATIVNLTPTWLYAEGSWGNKVKLGARWSSKAKESVALLLSYSSNASGYSATYMSLKGLPYGHM